MLRWPVILALVSVALSAITMFRHQDFRSNVMKYMDEYRGKSSGTGVKADRQDGFPKYVYIVAGTFFYMFFSRLAVKLLCYTHPVIDVGTEDEVEDELDD